LPLVADSHALNTGANSPENPRIRVYNSIKVPHEVMSSEAASASHSNLSRIVVLWFINPPPSRDNFNSTAFMQLAVFDITLSFACSSTRYSNSRAFEPIELPTRLSITADIQMRMGGWSIKNMNWLTSRVV
jgi:hypothetical protein